MKIIESGGIGKPKNFSRKVFICSCQCQVSLNGSKGTIIDRVMVKYEIIPNKEFHYEEPRSKHYWSTYEHWGELKKESSPPKLK